MKWKNETETEKKERTFHLPHPYLNKSQREWENRQPHVIISQRMSAGSRDLTKIFSCKVAWSGHLISKRGLSFPSRQSEKLIDQLGKRNKKFMTLLLFYGIWLKIHVSLAWPESSEHLVLITWMQGCQCNWRSITLPRFCLAKLDAASSIFWKEKGY